MLRRSGGQVETRFDLGLPVEVRELPADLHLRRFCRVIEEITRTAIAAATTGERRFVARVARIDSTVVEADIRYPTDLGLAADARKVLAREAAAVSDLAGDDGARVRDRSRAVTQRCARP
jgi:hypothetical protein